MLTLPDHPFRAYIFDCDGTLVDSMPLHYLAWVESLALHNAPFDFDEDVFYAYAGVREQDVVRIFNERHGTWIDPDSVANRKSEIFHRTIPQVSRVEPVAALAREAHGKLPMAVASGSEEHTVRACLGATGLLHLFDTIVTPKDVRRGKPAPDMFLLAAERLGVNPSECLVFEDGKSGIEAAAAAGMQAVFVPRALR
ncbi:MAG: beta-phosphoglucomutase family hydrolase [Verrucomicrobiaceae bacterium]|nr:beta-phosphoglucomutase family hydrolase [Verrucomicrobiaceae bacterium]